MSATKRAQNPLCVLVINFDYFVIASPAQRLHLLPEGQLETADWLSYRFWLWAYAQPTHGLYQELRACTAAEEQLAGIADILSWQHPDEVMLARSPRAAYGFIKKHAKSDVEVYLVGRRPGTETASGVITADSWLANLMRENVVAKAYWAGPEPGDGRMFPVDEISFSDLPTSGYDLIFACRSDWWVPPHLDDFFNEYIVAPVLDAGFPVTMEPGVDISRYTQKFREDVNNLRRKIGRGKGP